ncbi:MAG: hypothetical protein H0V10_06775 [Geodermatophilaceae bacterium]|nr:hypothetical protein [Geodermatophilaceae bacterium]
MSTAPVLAPYVRAAPPYQPPYDDELPPANLRLVVADTDELPFETQRGAVPDLAMAALFPLRRRLPDPTPWARQFIQAALEALSGRRPVAQLQRWTTPAVLAGIQHARRAEPGISQPVIVVKSIHVCEPADAVAEVCAVVSRPDADGPRFRAVAARLEGRSGQWRCVTLQVG